jgi:hypothetical protein
MVYSLMKIFISFLNNADFNSDFTVYSAAGLVFFNTQTCFTQNLSTVSYKG